MIRDSGAIPATIGVLNGVAKVGFTSEELTELLSSAGQRDTVKVSRRDLAQIIGRVILLWIRAESVIDEDLLTGYRVSSVASSTEAQL